MPHPTPTAAPEAPPLPRRGEEVGGHPRHANQARPGPEPGPRPTPRATLSNEVPGQARDGVVLGLSLAFTLALPFPALAQIIPTGSPAADILMSQALAEHRVFLTCSALDPAFHQQILTNWQRDIAAATAILTAQDVPPKAITAFTTAADPAAMMPATDTPWAEVNGLCATHPDWQKDYFQLHFTVLDLKLPEAFQ